MDNSEEKKTEKADIKNINNELMKNNKILDEVKSKFENTINNLKKDFNANFEEIRVEIEKLEKYNKFIEEENKRKLIEYIRSEDFQKELESQIDKYIEDKLNEKFNEKFISLIEKGNDKELFITGNVNNLKSIIFIILMLKAKNLNEIRNKKDIYLEEFYKDQKIPKKFKDFIQSIDDESKRYISIIHGGFARDIIFFIFALFGMKSEFNVKYKQFFNDELIKKVKAFNKKLYKSEIRELDTSSDLEKEYQNLKNLVKESEFFDIFN